MAPAVLFRVKEILSLYTRSAGSKRRRMQRRVMNKRERGRKGEERRERGKHGESVGHDRKGVKGKRRTNWCCCWTPRTGRAH
jgi:hypothetical protein